MRMREYAEVIVLALTASTPIVVNAAPDVGKEASPNATAKPAFRAMFTVSVLKEGEKTFARVVKGSPLFAESSCDPNPKHYNEINADFPRPTEGKKGSLKGKKGSLKFVRLSYECAGATAETFGIFGQASVAVAQERTIDPGETEESIRVVAEMLPGKGGGCAATYCQNGSYRRTTDWKSCAPC